MYIRTKDGRIIAFGKEYAYPTRIVKGNQHYIFTKLTEATFEKMKEFNYWEILKQSENLEKLCEGFYIDEGNEFSFYQENAYENFEEAKRDFFTNFDRTSTLYAFIKTSKGLIYVAKLNDKKEWELI